MKLYIDTTSNEVTKVSLTVNGHEDTLSEKHATRKGQVVLPLIDTLLKKHNKSLQDILEIQVNCGPGSFTGIRVGLAIANTLGSVLQVPINDKPIGVLAAAIYQ